MGMRYGRSPIVAIVTLALLSVPGPGLAQQPPANECTPSLGASSFESPGTLTFYGAVECRDAASLAGTTELFAPDGTQEASGAPFEVEAASARSDGRFFPAPAGSEHTLVFTLRIRSLDGRPWDAEPNRECRANGPELSCVFRRTFQA